MESLEFIVDKVTEFSCPAELQDPSRIVRRLCLSLHLLGWAHSFWRFLGPQLGLHFFEFELKPTGKDSADPTQHEFQHHIV